MVRGLVESLSSVCVLGASEVCSPVKLVVVKVNENLWPNWIVGTGFQIEIFNLRFQLEGSSQVMRLSIDDVDSTLLNY